MNASKSMHVPRASSVCLVLYKRFLRHLPGVLLAMLAVGWLAPSPASALPSLIVEPPSGVTMAERATVDNDTFGRGKHRH